MRPLLQLHQLRFNLRSLHQLLPGGNALRPNLLPLPLEYLFPRLSPLSGLLILMCFLLCIKWSLHFLLEWI